MSLLTADAMPEWSEGAELMAVEVSGATVIASPSPNTTTAGRTYYVAGPGRGQREQGQAGAGHHGAGTELQAESR
jgi:hypothetical protein